MWIFFVASSFPNSCHSLSAFIPPSLASFHISLMVYALNVSVSVSLLNVLPKSANPYTDCIIPPPPELPPPDCAPNAEIHWFVYNADLHRKACFSSSHSNHPLNFWNDAIRSLRSCSEKMFVPLPVPLPPNVTFVVFCVETV